jgi:hypothetical protein
MTWAGASMQPKKTQTPSPGTFAGPQSSRRCQASVRFSRTLQVQGLMPRVSGAFLDVSGGTVCRGQRQWDSKGRTGKGRGPECVSFLSAKDTVSEARPASLGSDFPPRGPGGAAPALSPPQFRAAPRAE